MRARTGRFCPRSALAGALLLVPVTLQAHAASDLLELLREYEAAKKAWTEWKTRQGRRAGPRGGGPGGFGGPGGPSGPGRRQERPDLEPILEKIARLGTPQSLRLLTREYGDRDPEIAAMAGVAILGSDHDNAARIVIGGFDRRGNWTAGARVRILDALASTASKDGPEFVLKMAERGKVESRALAIGSLRCIADSERCVDLLLATLENRSPVLKKAALRALKPLRMKRVIPALIERLGEEDNEEFRIEILRRLVDLTGKNMGLVADDWSKWWDVARTTFTVDEAARDRTVVLTPDLKYFGIEVASTRVSFLVDASRSMDQRPGERGGGFGGGGGPQRGRRGGGPTGKTKMDLLKDELSAILEKLPEETHVNIIYFHRGPFPWKPELHPLAGRGRSEAIAFVRALTTEFATNIYDTLELALGDRRVDTIFLLSDGRPFGGKYTETEDILREIGAINRVRGARINCIGFGRETELLKELAAQNDGEYRAADGEDDSREESP